ncbi:MAG: GNAT family N-acetyltransferase [Burkholderiaceae bacterium]
MPATQPLVVRGLTRSDLADVVAIDASIEGRSRRDYVQRRLAAALRDPALHAQFGALDGTGLAGHILARVLEGEFGRDARSLRLELIGVRPDAHHHGVGARLFEALVEWAARHAIGELRTQAAWNDFVMLRWLDAMGFELAQNSVIDCEVAGGAYRAERDDALPVGDSASGEIDFSPASGNHFERLARDTAEVGAMTPADLDDIARIDRRITGRDRSTYLQAKLAEALDDSSLRVSLAARRDGLTVGYLMARVDRGDFGRTEPVAVLDTLGVDPAAARRGVGRAMLSQLFANLGALRVERVETVVARTDLALLGFFDKIGFKASQRLAFVRRLA